MTNTFRIPRKYTSAQANIYFNPNTGKAFISNFAYSKMVCSESTMERLHNLSYNPNVKISYFRSEGENWIIFQRREIPKTPEVLALSKH